MKRFSLAITAALALASPALAQTADELSVAAYRSAVTYMGATIMCEPVVGSAYIPAGRIVVENMARAHGLSGDALTVQVAEIEEWLRSSQTNEQRLESIVGRNGVSAGDLEQACMQQMTEALNAAEVALARFRQATGP